MNQGVGVNMVAERWYALETMVLANTPGAADGEMALWVDGTLVAHHQGILWRDTAELLLDHFVAWNYFPEATSLHQVWFDDLVVSTAPIGLRDMAPGNPDGGAAGGDGGAAAQGPSGGCGCHATGERGAPGGRWSLLAGILLCAVCFRRRGRPV
jgi:hypothetical protein